MEVTELAVNIISFMLTLTNAQESSSKAADNKISMMIHSNNSLLMNETASIIGNITFKNITSTIIVERNNNDTTLFKETAIGPLAARAGSLALFIFLGFSGNFIIVATVAHSTHLRSSSLNLIIVSLALVNLLDTTVNLPIILGSTITQNWEYGTFICQFNSFMVSLVNVNLVMTVLLLTIDRLVAVSDLRMYKKSMTRKRTSILVFCSWIYSLIVTSPIFSGAVSSIAFHERYMCSISPDTSIVYITFSILLGLWMPVIGIIVSGLLIFRIIQLKRHSGDIQGTGNRSQQLYSNDWNADPDAWALEISGVKFVGTLFLFWCLLVGPYLTLNYIELYRNSIEIQNVLSDVRFSYPWEVDLSFTWMKLSYSIVLPLVAYIGRKDLKNKIKDLILCRKSNLVIDASPKQISQKSLENDAEHGSGCLNTSQTASFKVPVLFATSQGLHVQTFTDDELTESDSDFTYSDNGGAEILGDSKILRSRKCDVNASVENVNDDTCTSDYDSENENTTAYIESIPVSVTTSDVSNQSILHIEPLQKEDVSLKSLEESCENNIKALEKGDSGIDSVPTTQEKKKRKKQTSTETTVTDFEPEPSNCATHKQNSLVYDKHKEHVSKKRKTKHKKHSRSDTVEDKPRFEEIGPSHEDGIVLRPPPRLIPLKEQNGFTQSKDSYSLPNGQSKHEFKQVSKTTEMLKLESREFLKKSSSQNDPFSEDSRRKPEKLIAKSREAENKIRKPKSSRRKKINIEDLHLNSLKSVNIDKLIKPENNVEKVHRIAFDRIITADGINSLKDCNVHCETQKNENETSDTYTRHNKHHRRSKSVTKNTVEAVVAEKEFQRLSEER